MQREINENYFNIEMVLKTQIWIQGVSKNPELY